MLLDIVILPPAKLRQRLGKKIRTATKGIPNVFVVDNRKLIPHLTLVHIKTSRKNLQKISDELERLASRQRPFKIETKSFNLAFSGSKIGYYSITIPKRLKELHKMVVKTCTKYRTGSVPWPFKRKLEKRQNFFIQEYGTHNIFEFYHPHFTMLNLKNETDFTRVKNVMKGSITFKADTVYLCKVNKQLQVIRILKQFKFQTLGEKERRNV